MSAFRSRINKVIIQRVSLTLFFCLISGFAFAQSELPISKATASSSYSSYTASKAKDKNLSTYWRGASSKSSWWLKLDLGKNYSLTHISIFWHNTYGSTNYNIQGSTGNKAWTNLYNGLSSAGGTANPYQKNYNLTGSYRYLRLYINKPQKSYPIIYEVKLYGNPPDTTSPTGTIKINNDAQYTNSTKVTLNLSAQDNAGGSGLSQMRFSNNKSSWSTPETYATTKSWTLTTGDGKKTAYVKFKDVAGNWSAPVSDTIILDTKPPGILIISPQDNFFTNQKTITVNYTVDGQAESETRTLTEGLNTITITATDAAGNSASKSIKGTLDTTPPEVSITSPANNATVSSVINIQAQSTDNVAVAKVEFFVDETLKSSATALPYSYSWDSTAVSNGNHTLKAIAYDTSNNSSQVQVSVNVNNVAPPPQSELPISSASASSSYSSYTASKAKDKNLSTYWRGASSKSSWWLKLDLGKNCSLSHISIFWHKDYGSTNYNIQGSTDNKAWTNLYNGLSSAGGTANPYQKNYNLTGSYRYLRLYINEPQKSYPIIYEVKLYGGQILSISLAPKFWNIGSTEINKVITMAQANKITVTNDGSGPETLELKLTDPLGWTASTSAGPETYVLSGLFCNAGDIPEASHFNQDAISEDIITTNSIKAAQAIFAYAQATANGVAVPSGGIRSLYLQFKSPTVTQKKEEQNISVIVSCQIP